MGGGVVKGAPFLIYCSNIPILHPPSIANMLCLCLGLSLGILVALLKALLGDLTRVRTPPS